MSIIKVSLSITLTITETVFQLSHMVNMSQLSTKKHIKQSFKNSAWDLFNIQLALNLTQELMIDLKNKTAVWLGGLWVSGALHTFQVSKPLALPHLLHDLLYWNGMWSTKSWTSHISFSSPPSTTTSNITGPPVIHINTHTTLTVPSMFKGSGPGWCWEVVRRAEGIIGPIRVSINLCTDKRHNRNETGLQEEIWSWGDSFYEFGQRHHGYIWDPQLQVHLGRDSALQFFLGIHRFDIDGPCKLSKIKSIWGLAPVIIKHLLSTGSTVCQHDHLRAQSYT